MRARPARRRSSRLPKTARMITSSVSAWVRGRRGDHARRPARDLALGDVADQLAVGLHALAVERTAASPCARPCARDRRAAGRCLAPSSGLRIELPSPAWSTFGSPVKTRLTSSGCDDHHPRQPAVDVQGERVAVALAQPARVRAGACHPAGGMAEVRTRRAGRKGHAYERTPRVRAGEATRHTWGLGLAASAWVSVSGAPRRRRARPAPRRARRCTGRDRSPSAARARSSAAPRWRPSRATTSMSIAGQRVHHDRLRAALLGEPVQHGAAAEPLGGVVEQRLRGLAGECVHARDDLARGGARAGPGTSTAATCSSVISAARGVAAASTHASQPPSVIHASTFRSRATARP